MQTLKQNVRTIMERLSFPENARAVFLDALDCIAADRTAAAWLGRLVAQYDESENCDYLRLLADSKALGAALDITGRGLRGERVSRDGEYIAGNGVFRQIVPQKNPEIAAVHAVMQEDRDDLPVLAGSVPRERLFRILRQGIPGRVHLRQPGFQRAEI